MKSKYLKLLRKACWKHFWLRHSCEEFKYQKAKGEAH